MGFPFLVEHCPWSSFPLGGENTHTEKEWELKPAPGSLVVLTIAWRDQVGDFLSWFSSGLAFSDGSLATCLRCANGQTQA